MGLATYAVVAFLACMDWCSSCIAGFGEGGFAVEPCGGSDFVVAVAASEEVRGILGDRFAFLEMMVGTYC